MRTAAEIDHELDVAANQRASEAKAHLLPSKELERLMILRAAGATDTDPTEEIPNGCDAGAMRTKELRSLRKLLDRFAWTVDTKHHAAAQVIRLVAGWVEQWENSGNLK
jgi:hypothetical protein